MKKSSSESVLKSNLEDSVQVWIPAPMGKEPKPVMPSFLVENQDQQGESPPERSVIKGGTANPSRFVRWMPTDILQDQGWMKSQQGTQGSSSHQVSHPAAQTRGASLSENQQTLQFDSSSEELQQLIEQARQQAERKVIREQEQQLDSVKAEAEQLLNTAEAVLSEIEQLRDEIITNSEESILNLVLDISKALFADGLSLEKEILEKVILDALREAKELGNLILHLHPEDIDLLDPHWPEGLLGSSKDLQLLPDTEVERGGCLIEGDYGEVDARVSTKFQEICSALREVHNTHSAENKHQEDHP